MLEILTTLFNTWQLNFVIYLVSVVSFFQFYKLAVSKTKNDGAATVTLQLLGAVSSIIFIPFFALNFPSEMKWYLLLLGACLFYATSDRLQTTARKHLQVSVVTIINQLQTVFLIIYGWTIFHDEFSFSKLIGALLIISANLLLNLKENRLQINKYVGLAVIATFVFSIALSVDIGISSQFNLPIYVLITLALPALIISFAEKVTLQNISQELSSSTRKYYLLTGISWALTIIFALRSFQLGEVTTIVPLQATSVMLNVIVAYIFLKERSEIEKKLFAALMVMAGIYLTVVH
ncbi:MAG TPA: EamA family transporter [Candidatus Woesebacteria bacterium]|nr:EamA family transporter [Candidatus Woesebacteria bacterium]